MGVVAVAVVSVAVAVSMAVSVVTVGGVAVSVVVIRIGSGLGGSDGFSLVFGVELHELGKIELGLLEDLGLVDKDVLEGEDFVALVSDLLGDGVTEDLLEEVLEGGFLGFVDHNLLHLGADELLLSTSSVAGSLDLSLVASGESDAEHADQVAVQGLGLNEGFNGGVPLLDEGAELVSGDIHSVEVGVEIESLDFLALDADLSPGLLVSVTVQIGKRHLENTASKTIR